MNATLMTLLLAALSTAILPAQRGPRLDGSVEGNAATSVERRIARLATLLTLTDSQRTQATTIFTTAQTAAAAAQAGAYHRQRGAADGGSQ
jgi:hypothetical protein